jgi:hypothetical protein
MWNSCPVRVASSRERLLAALVDAAVLICGMVVAVGLGVGAALAYARVRSEDDEDEADPAEGEDEEDASPMRSPGDGDLDDQDDLSPATHHRTEEFLQSPLLRAALFGAGAGLAVANRNWRSPGFRVVGLRRVDARTGGPVSVRSVLTGVLFDQARQAAARPLFRSRVARQRDRVRELAQKLNEIERKHADDQPARRRAVKEFYEANGGKPLPGCGWQLAGPVFSQVVLAAAIRNGRTVYDRLTGTTVIADR